MVEHEKAQNGGVVLDANGPTPGAGPEELIQGFLRACAAGVSDDFRVARQFLTPEAAARWNPGSGVTIYSDAEPVEYSYRADGAVIVTAPSVGTLDAAGRYAQASAEATASQAFSLMANEDGEWRIATLEDSLLMAQTVFSSQYLRTPLYFYTADRSALVPDVRWYPRSRALTLMSNDLLASPSDWLVGAARSIFENKENNAEIAVTLIDATAVVELPDGAAGLEPLERSLLQLQFEKTLVGSGLAQQVELAVQGALIEADSDLDIPSYPYVSAPLSALQDGKLVNIQGAEVAPTQAESDFTQRSYSAIAADYGAPAARIVGLSADRSRLTKLVVATSDSEELLAGNNLAKPSIDSLGWVWSADAGDPGALIAVNLDTGARVRLQVPEIGEGSVEQVIVSREGARVVVINARAGGTELLAYAVRRGESGRPEIAGEPLLFGQGFTQVRDVSWISEAKMLVLGNASGGGLGGNSSQASGGRGAAEAGSDSSLGAAAASLYTLDIGGHYEQVRAAAPDMVAVSSGRGLDSAVVIDSRGNAYRYSGSAWNTIATGVTTIAFPG